MGNNSVSPENPVHHCTQENDGSDYTDWSYVYFGSYPQTEVTGSELTTAITGASYDANGDAWVNGTKYRRLSKSDTNNDVYFGDMEYRYFKWERIKWKVLDNTGSTLFVMADKGLDCKRYHEEDVSVTWEDCSLRNWLNDTFYKEAFSQSEQSVIVKQKVENKNNPQYGTEGGNTTTDRVYLLSIEETTTPEYGFCEKYDTNSVSRGIFASDYSRAKGSDLKGDGFYIGNCLWWLRSPGISENSVAVVNSLGDIYWIGSYAYEYYRTCIPALHINILSDLWYLTDDGSSGVGGSMGNPLSVNGPSSQIVNAENSAEFTIKVSGGNPNYYSYQWYYSLSPTEAGIRIEGAESSSYKISSNDMSSDLNGRYYYCIVSNGTNEMTSDRAKLTVYFAPDIISPENASVKIGNSATFSVNVSGGNPSTYTYQWYYVSSSTGAETKIDGAVSPSYTIPSGSMTSDLNGRYYYCVVSNGVYEIASGYARLEVLDDK